MKKLIIEWKHLEVQGETCDRCDDTSQNLVNEIKRLNRTLEPQGIHVEVKEIVLDESKVSQSNMVLIDGVPIEDILDITIADNYCESCSEMIGKTTLCRTVIYEGKEYEDIPTEAIRRAVHHMLRKT